MNLWSLLSCTYLNGESCELVTVPKVEANWQIKGELSLLFFYTIKAFVMGSAASVQFVQPFLSAVIMCNSCAN